MDPAERLVHVEYSATSTDNYN